MDTLEGLSAEVHRIIVCPYVPSLKILHDILQDAELPLEIWALGNECQVNALSAIVLEGLELFPYALDILTRLASLGSFRNAVLRNRPMLLDSFLRKANESDNGYEKYAPACVALLSSQPEIAIPAAFPQFLSRLLKRAVRELAVETLEPIHRVLSSLGKNHVEEIPLELLLNMQETLITGLRGLNVEEHSTNLFSLAILSILSAWTVNGMTGRGRVPAILNRTETCSQDSTGQEGPLAPTYQFFNTRRSPKILDFVIIKAILMTSPSSGLTCCQIKIGLGLCSQIVAAVELSEKQSWIAKSNGKIRKFQERILQDGLNKEIWGVSLKFLDLLSGGAPLPPSICGILEQHPICFDKGILPFDGVIVSLQNLDALAIKHVLIDLLKVADSTSLTNMVNITRLENAKTIAKALDAIHCSASVSEAIQGGVEDGQFNNLICSLLKSKSPLAKEVAKPCCDCHIQHLQEIQLDLQVLIGSTILNVSLGKCCSTLETISRSILTFLSETRRSARQSVCPWVTQQHRANSASVSTFEAQSTPSATPISQEWKKRLMQDMSRDTMHRSEQVIRTVGHVCRDLESRCENIEGPLRKERERSHELHARIAETESRIKTMDDERREQSYQIAEMEKETNALHEQIKVSSESVLELNSSLEKANGELEHSKTEARTTLEAILERSRQQDLAYLATITAKDEKIEEQMETILTLESKIKTLGCDLNDLSMKSVKAAETATLAQQSTEQIRSTVAELESSIKKERAEKASLQQSRDEYLKINSDLMAKADTDSKQQASEVAEIKTQLAAAELMIVQERENHNLYMTEREALQHQLEDEHRAVIAEMTEKLRSAQSQASQTINTQEAEIKDLRSEINHLRQQQEVREREFAEAQDLSSKLMAVMGMKRPAAVPHPAARNFRDSVDVSSPENCSNDVPCHGQTQSQPSEDSLDSIHDARAKRTRIQRCLTSPSESLQNRSSQGKRKQISARATGKIALMPSDKAANRGVHVTNRDGNIARNKISSEFNTKHDENQVMRSQDALEDSFDDGDIFTSTDHQKLLNQHDVMHRATSDETTVEF